MDNSQSSDYLSESTDIFCVSPTNPGKMDVDTVSYTSLVSNTKTAFSSIRRDIQKSIFPSCFSSLLDDCSTCISQSLDLITEMLASVDIKHKELIEYMNDAVCLLQLLSDLIKNVIETISMSCCSIKNFPTATGRIILLVFIHCKDSATLYGSQLNYVEKQLKDLFRTCHELQLTYLMVLEKQFIFDLTEREEQDILIEALDINLKIGEIVQSLDVKTMAEQWKAYTMICEKYSNNLMDKKIYCDSTKFLCSMITNNIKTALEENQDEKSILRSLKVSSFTLKILLRVCNTFRHSVVKDYESIVELLLFIHLNSEPYLLTIGGKSSQFISLFNSNVSSPINTLLNELLLDENLVLFICNYDINKIRKDDKLLGVILLVISVIRIVIQNSDRTIKAPKHAIVDVIYSFLPLCDSGYAQRPYLMTPFNNPGTGTPEKYYNDLHSSARNSVERTIGILKGRFRCLLVHRVLHYDPIMVGKIVTACCVLHNMCNQAGVPAPKLSETEINEEADLLRTLTQQLRVTHDDLVSGQLSRRDLMNQLWRARHHT